ncbi:MAG: hypothetical protein KF724_13010 [Phycisphaeraceae bacterium]|nr:hypothetical protein [Phycisphaeraceae bacterium]
MLQPASLKALCAMLMSHVAEKDASLALDTPITTMTRPQAMLQDIGFSLCGLEIGLRG